MHLTRLLDAFADLPEPLPADQVAGLVALAAGPCVTDSVRFAVIARSDVDAASAFSLVRTGPGRVGLGQYLARPDVPTGEVLDALAGNVPAHVPRNVASLSRTPMVLAALADHPDLEVRQMVTRNTATPLPAAVAALTSAVEAVTPPGRRYHTSYGQVHVDADPHDPCRPYRWLMFAHTVPNPVVAAWAATATNLSALLAVVTHRPDLDAAAAARTIDLTLALIPDGERDIATVPEAHDALVDLARHRMPDRAREHLIRRLVDRQLLVGKVDAAFALGLAPVPAEIRPAGARAWRHTSKAAATKTELAAAVLAALADAAGPASQNPTTWHTMARLSAQHTGTVADLAHAAAAVAAPAAAT